MWWSQLMWFGSSETRRQTAALSSYTHSFTRRGAIVKSSECKSQQIRLEDCGSVRWVILTLMQQSAKNRLQRRKTTRTVTLCISVASLSCSRATGPGPVPSALGKHGAPGTEHHAASFHSGLIDRCWAWHQPIRSQNELTSECNSPRPLLHRQVYFPLIFS